ncbi:lysine 2,3-aminomutase [Anaerotignum sp.]|uniref:lysine 2,3-aminomutase n=1 Tax=Anaerotignum sp. TaxID=2039241 RepID=UPI00289BBD69|nr:lysine 2,3-aminomutase [Anaerotignum sp.]
MNREATVKHINLDFKSNLLGTDNERSDQSFLNRKKFFPNVSTRDWNDWKWQMRNRIETVDDLSMHIELTPEEAMGIKKCLGTLRMAITPYYLSLIDINNPHDPIRKQAIPTTSELELSSGDCSDPLHEEEDSPVPGLTHRYPDRVLLLVTDKCAMYCRHCTRRRFAGQSDHSLPMEQIQKAIDYIARTPVIRDVLISGGDPLLLSDQKLEQIIKRLRAIPHVEIIRIGSRVPVVMPQRITPELVEMLKKYHPLWLNTHFNHPNEITVESKKACELLANAGIPLGNQTVLLRGVNDCIYIMKKLMHELVKIRVRPYYIYQCDLSMGIKHFRTKVSKGIEIIEGLRGHTSGFAVPTFVIDAPGGGGKIPVMPNYLISTAENKVILRNFEGVITTYQEPEDYVSECNCKDCSEKKNTKQVGLLKLIYNNKISLEPSGLIRNLRKKNR